MSHPLLWRVFVLVLAVLVTAGMGLSAVQASNMSMNNMTMAGMVMTGTAKCSNCGTFGDSKGMTTCAAPTCAAQVVAESPLVVAFALVVLPVRHSFQSHILSGRDTVPDPYPQRTTDIG